MWIVLTLAAMAATPVSLPPGESATDWAEPLRLADLVASLPPAPIVIRTSGTSWIITVTRADGQTRSTTVAAPHTTRDREDIAILAASLVRVPTGSTWAEVGPLPYAPPREALAFPALPPEARAPIAADPVAPAPVAPAPTAPRVQARASAPSPAAAPPPPTPATDPIATVDESTGPRVDAVAVAPTPEGSVWTLAAIPAETDPVLASPEAVAPPPVAPDPARAVFPTEPDSSGSLNARADRGASIVGGAQLAWRPDSAPAAGFSALLAYRPAERVRAGLAVGVTLPRSLVLSRVAELSGEWSSVFLAGELGGTLDVLLEPGLFVQGGLSIRSWTQQDRTLATTPVPFVTVAVDGRVSVAQGWALRPLVGVVVDLRATELQVAGEVVAELPRAEGVAGLHVEWRTGR